MTFRAEIFPWFQNFRFMYIDVTAHDEEFGGDTVAQKLVS